jgi:hypothetical protein
MEDLVKELKHTKEELIKAISSINEDEFNEVPFEDSWTAAQVSEHLLKAIGISTLYGGIKTTDRDPGEKIAETGELFLNMDIKMKSPDFILPSDKKHTRKEIIDEVDITLSKLIEAAETLDLSKTCTDFAIPGFGDFTRLEFIWFYIFHTQRHTNQLKNINKALAN